MFSLLGSALGNIASSAFGGLFGGGSKATPPPQLETPMPQTGQVIQAQNKGSVESSENALSSRRGSMPTKPLKDMFIDAGKEGLVNLARNKASDAIYGTKAEQDLAYMDKVFPNTDPYERLTSGSGGALQASTAEKVARVNANTSKKVASINQNTGAIAKAQVRQINANIAHTRQQTKTEQANTDIARVNARHQERLNVKASSPSGGQFVPWMLNSGLNRAINQNFYSQGRYPTLESHSPVTVPTGADKRSWMQQLKDLF